MLRNRPEKIAQMIYLKSTRFPRTRTKEMLQWCFLENVVKVNSVEAGVGQRKVRSLLGYYCLLPPDIVSDTVKLTC